jgi:hypothetical protein
MYPKSQRPHMVVGIFFIIELPISLRSIGAADIPFPSNCYRIYPYTSRMISNQLI